MKFLAVFLAVFFMQATYAAGDSDDERETKTSNQAEVSDSLIIHFYDERLKSDGEQSLLDEYLSQSFDDAERKHDYIQWLFPTKFKNNINGFLDPLTDADIAQFKTRPILRKNVLRAFDFMLDFYGFARIVTEDAVAIEKTRDFQTKAKNWMSYKNHNYMRILRILLCLKVLGFDAEARAFISTLQEVCNDHTSEIGSAVLKVWQKAESNSFSPPKR